jgi:type IV secretory pathway VirB2 component (pilin)
MFHFAPIRARSPKHQPVHSRLSPALKVFPIALVFVVPLAAHAQGSPFDTGFSAIQSLFTGTIAKVASLVAIVIGGYGFAHGEPGATRGVWQ